VAKNEQKPPPGFTSEEIQEEIAVESSRQKVKAKPVDRNRMRDWKHLNEVFNSGQRDLFLEACDAVGATEGTEKRKQMLKHFDDTHGF
jgi:hypothetical protein